MSRGVSQCIALSRSLPLAVVCVCSSETVTNPREGDKILLSEHLARFTKSRISSPRSTETENVQFITYVESEKQTDKTPQQEVSDEIQEHFKDFFPLTRNCRRRGSAALHRPSPLALRRAYSLRLAANRVHVGDASYQGKQTHGNSPDAQRLMDSKTDKRGTNFRLSVAHKRVRAMAKLERSRTRRSTHRFEYMLLTIERPQNGRQQFL